METISTRPAARAQESPVMLNLDLYIALTIPHPQAIPFADLHEEYEALHGIKIDLRKAAQEYLNGQPAQP